MRRFRAVVGSALFLVVAPGTLAGLIPKWISRWQVQEPASWWMPVRAAGVLLIAAAAAVLIDSFVRFALQGLGTPAPPFPTRHLVVTGLYRYVRNPMYVAVLSLIVGQALLLGNVGLLAYGAAVWLGFHAFVLAYEEPVLRSTFGAEYEEFRDAVPRWIPRLRPWR